MLFPSISFLVSSVITSHVSCHYITRQRLSYTIYLNTFCLVYFLPAQHLTHAKGGPHPGKSPVNGHDWGTGVCVCLWSARERLCVCVYVCARAGLCFCVCVCEREREREIARARECVRRGPSIAEDHPTQAASPSATLKPNLSSPKP